MSRWVDDKPADKPDWLEQWARERRIPYHRWRTCCPYQRCACSNRWT